MSKMTEKEMAEWNAWHDRHVAEEKASLARLEVDKMKGYINYVTLCIKNNEPPLTQREYENASYGLSEDLRCLNDPCFWFYNDAGMKEKAQFQARADEMTTKLHWGQVA